MKRHGLIRALLALLPAGLFIAQLATAAPLPNAWQITDDTESAATARYSTNLPAAQQGAALTNGWRYTIHARLLEDFADTATMLFLYGVGTNRFSIFWDLDANDDITATPFGQPTLKLTTNGTGAAFYHTYEIAYHPTSRQATLFFDGIQRAVWDGDNVIAANGLIEWGSGSSVGQGIMNFHTVTFTIGTDGVAAYDAGTQGSPTIAPDPRSQGWTAIGELSETTTNAISPDVVASPAPLVVTTLAPTGLEPHEATLRGGVRLGGLAALAWLEWGATTNYGSSSPSQFFKADTNTASLSHNLTNLAARATYHFRCVATNLLGIAYGEDLEFTTPPWVVTSLANSGAGSLRQAIAGDIITFGVTGRIVLTSGQLDIVRNLTILGPGPANLRIDAGGDSRVFRVLSGTTNRFSGVTVTNGHAPDGGTGAGGLNGGGIHNAGNLALSNCVISANRAGRGGNGSSPSVGNGGSAGNGGDGGGIYNTGNLTLLSCTVTNNSAGDGGHGGYGSTGPDPFDAHGRHGGDGGDGGDGGGIYSSTAFLCVDSVIVRNATGEGGDGGDGGDAYGFSLGGNGGNGGDGGDIGEGGGAYAGGTATLTNCDLRQNGTASVAGSAGSGGLGTPGGNDGTVGFFGAAGAGGGVLNSTTSTFSGCAFAHNSSHGGGAIFTRAGTLTLNDCSLESNVGLFAAGIGLGNTPATLVIRRSTLWNNSSTNSGGGIHSSGVLHLENCTCTGNRSSADGGAIYHIGAPSSLTLVNCTLVANNATDGGGIFSAVSSVMLTNSIVAGNFPDNIMAPSVAGANNLTNGNPMVASLGDYGGPTRTMPPLPGSLAIDAGRDSVTNFLATDQRGYRRRSGARVDIGAVEVHVSDPDNPLLLNPPERLGNGTTILTLAGDPAASAFSVYASTNVAAPSNQWIRLGSTTQPLPGQFLYTDTTAINFPLRFYKVVWP